MIVVVSGTTDPEVEVEVIPAQDAYHFGYLIIGPDGAVWDLVAGPVKAAPGIRGLGIPEPTHWTDEFASVDGATYKGSRTGPREVSIPVNIEAPTADDMLHTDAAFAAAIAPENLCSLVVVAPDSSYRTLPIRYDRGAEGEYDLDILLAMYANYSLEFTATDPWWHTPEVVRTISAAAAVPFYPGPPWLISGSSVFGNASTTNPGDKPAWEKWRVNGPFTSFTVGVGAAAMSVTTTKTAGQWIEANMDPTNRTIVDNTGADMRDLVTDAVFAPIPPGESTLTVNVAGSSASSSVELRYVPNYRRAW